MKKFFCILLVIVLSVTALYFYDIYSDGKLLRTFDNITQTEEITTTEVYSENKTDTVDENTLSLSWQVNAALTTTEQEVFDIIYDGLSTYKSSVFIYQNIDTQRIFDIVGLVLTQHPEIFWSKGDCTFSSARRLTFKYPYTDQQIQEKKALIEQKAKDIIEKIGTAGDDYEKSLAIFDYITTHTDYADTELENINEHMEITTVEGVLLDGRAICSGYAKAYQYLLSLCGIDAITVIGEAKTSKGTQRHAWTAQVVDGEIYFSDTTWGDGLESSGDDDFVIHTYFMMNSEEIEKTHTCDDEFKGIKSNTLKNNYFVRQGLYLDEYNYAQARDIMKREFENGKIGVELKFANSREFEKAEKSFFKNENLSFIMAYIDPLFKSLKPGAVSYVCDDVHNTMIIFFPFREK